MAAEPDKNLTPHMAVVCLVAQLADTVAGISKRLRQMFPAAQFPESSAHNSTKSLTKEGYLRLVGKGERRALNLYEATEKGAHLSRTWRLTSGIPPQTRDTLLGRLAFSEGPDEIRTQIDLILEEELAYKAKHDEVYGRAQTQKRNRSAESGIDWRAELDAIKLKNECELLMTLARRCHKVRGELEDLLVRLEAA